MVGINSRDTETVPTGTGLTRIHSALQPVRGKAMALWPTAAGEGLPKHLELYQ